MTAQRSSLSWNCVERQNDFTRGRAQKVNKQTFEHGLGPPRALRQQNSRAQRKDLFSPRPSSLLLVPPFDRKKNGLHEPTLTAVNDH
ncbi:hypothetical protein AVEN_101278-1 [Araneus ventricosus]|uniref:Uncharacterized protein n=1 Tax=Araneus ventricosus TaxID=182803 RepID=A0A4Y2EUS1_ARAVE|nr:hypothetical protein AVEN_101278-1 [Araneus ventricosus]